MEEFHINERLFLDEEFVKLDPLDQCTFIRLFRICDRNWGVTVRRNMRALAVDLWPEKLDAALDGNAEAVEFLTAREAGLYELVSQGWLVTDETSEGLAVGYRSWETYTGAKRTNRCCSDCAMGPNIARHRNWNSLHHKSIQKIRKWAEKHGLSEFLGDSSSPRQDGRSSVLGEECATGQAFLGKNGQPTQYPEPSTQNLEPSTKNPPPPDAREDGGGGGGDLCGDQELGHFSAEPSSSPWLDCDIGDPVALAEEHGVSVRDLERLAWYCVSEVIAGRGRSAAGLFRHRLKQRSLAPESFRTAREQQVLAQQGYEAKVEMERQAEAAAIEAGAAKRCDTLMRLGIPESDGKRWAALRSAAMRQGRLFGKAFSVEVRWTDVGGERIAEVCPVRVRLTDDDFAKIEAVLREDSDVGVVLRICEGARASPEEHCAMQAAAH